MNMTSHARERAAERTMLRSDSIEAVVESMYLDGIYSGYPPSWYDDNLERWELGITDNINWVQFFDIDGVPCCAAVDKITSSIVTVVRKDA